MPSGVDPPDNDEWQKIRMILNSSQSVEKFCGDSVKKKKNHKHLIIFDVIKGRSPGKLTFECQLSPACVVSN
jgi:hypothetical protein